MPPGHSLVGNTKFDREQFRLLIYGLFLPQSRWAKWVRSQKNGGMQPRAVYWCYNCRRGFNSTILPQSCPYCKVVAGPMANRLFDQRKDDPLVFPFLVATVRVERMTRLMPTLLGGWGSAGTQQ